MYTIRQLEPKESKTQYNYSREYRICFILEWNAESEIIKLVPRVFFNDIIITSFVAGVLHSIFYKNLYKFIFQFFYKSLILSLKYQSNLIITVLTKKYN